MEYTFKASANQKPERLIVWMQTESGLVRMDKPKVDLSGVDVKIVATVNLCEAVKDNGDPCTYRQRVGKTPFCGVHWKGHS